MTIFLARLAVVLAVLLQSVGKVTYGIRLSDFPAPTFVFIGFALATLVFWSAPNRKIGVVNWLNILLLNVATACTFISIFIALKTIEPATVGAIEIGSGPVFAAFFGAILMAERIGGSRVVVCAGILLGCCLLAYAAFGATGQALQNKDILIGLLLSLFAGAGAVVISITSKSLMAEGWNQAAILSHRSYVIIPVAFILWQMGDYDAISWSVSLAAEVTIICSVSIVIPLYLLLVGLKYCDVYTVMVTMAVQPCITFALEFLSSGYNPTGLTAFGILIVTSFVLMDVVLASKRYSILRQRPSNQNLSRVEATEQTGH